MTLAGLERVFRALGEAGVRYLVAGGVAVNAHGYRRLTHDLDLILQLDPQNVQAALSALAALGYRPLLPVKLEDFAVPSVRREWIERRNLQVFSLTADLPDGITVDLFADEPVDFESEYGKALAAEVAPGLRVRFLRIPALIRMKAATGRARDREDAEALRHILEATNQETHDDT
jgi:hypothetical protein